MPRAGVGLMDILNFAHILQEYLGGGSYLWAATKCIKLVAYWLLNACVKGN